MNEPCAHCGKPGHHEHHIIARRLRPDLIDAPENKLWLCRKCHGAVTFLENSCNRSVMDFYRKLPEPRRSEVLAYVRSQGKSRREVEAKRRLPTSDQVGSIFREFNSRRYAGTLPP